MTGSTSDILLLTPTLHTIGGVENYYNALDLSAHDNRIQHFFVTGGRRESIVLLLYRLARNYFRFIRLIAGVRYGLVIINPSLNANSFYRDAIFCWLALVRGKRVLVFFRGWSELFEARLRRASVARFLYRRSFAKVRNFIVLGSVFEQKVTTLGCSNNARFWIESTVADGSFLPDFSITMRAEPRQRIRVLFLSRMTAAKGATVALRAFKLASEQLTDLPLELVMAGDGAELPMLKALAEAEQIENVQFTGTVSGAQKKRALFDSDIFLFPTMHAEGMPNVILEAMLYGLPVITRAAGAISDIVIDGKNGFLLDTTDPAAFAEKLIVVAKDQDLRYRMASENHKKALSNYASDVVRGRVLRIIDSVSAS